MDSDKLKELERKIENVDGKAWRLEHRFAIFERHAAEFREIFKNAVRDLKSPNALMAAIWMDGAQKAIQLIADACGADGEHPSYPDDAELDKINPFKKER